MTRTTVSTVCYCPLCDALHAVVISAHLHPRNGFAPVHQFHGATHSPGTHSTSPCLPWLADETNVQALRTYRDDADWACRYSRIPVDTPFADFPRNIQPGDVARMLRPLR
jgi:hypothetical protein